MNNPRLMFHVRPDSSRFFQIKLINFMLSTCWIMLTTNGLATAIGLEHMKIKSLAIQLCATYINGIVSGLLYISVAELCLSNLSKKPIGYAIDSIETDQHVKLYVSQLRNITSTCSSLEVLAALFYRLQHCNLEPLHAPSFNDHQLSCDDVVLHTYALDEVTDTAFYGRWIGYINGVFQANILFIFLFPNSNPGGIHIALNLLCAVISEYMTAPVLSKSLCLYSKLLGPCYTGTFFKSDVQHMREIFNVDPEVDIDTPLVP